MSNFFTVYHHLFDVFLLGSGYALSQWVVMRAGVFSVYTMLVSGEDQVKLTPDQGPEFDPAWSVDGRQVAYTAVRDSNAEVFVIEVGGFNPRNLTRHGANDFKPSWSRETR